MQTAKLVILFSVAAAWAALSAQSVSFNASLDFPAEFESGGPVGIGVGDFNGDGRPDVAASYFGGEVQIFLNQGGGYFHMSGTYNIGNFVLRNVATGDFDHDGNLDLAIVVDGAGVSILFGNGDGTFQPAVIYNVGPNPINVAVGDFDADGRLDLAVATGSGIAILTNRGNGAFRAPINYGTDPYFTMVVGDFNGDGHPDLAALNTVTAVVGVMLNRGDGTFGPVANFAAGSAPFTLASADLNGDGYLDFAIGNPNANTLDLLYGNGDGTFAAPQTLPAPGCNAVAIADVNHDGFPDVAAIVTGGFSIFLGAGGGSFAPPVTYDSPTAGPFVARDFNHDGKVDLLLGTGLDTLSLYLGNGDGTFRATSGSTVPGSIGIEQTIAADFNGDGKIDLAMSNPPNVTIQIGNGDGTFQPAVNYPVGSYPWAITAGDFNRDGKIDLAVTDSSGVWILLGSGDGTFRTPVSYPAGPYPDSIASADFNGDGKLDLVVGDNGHNRYSISVLLGNGDGTFQPFIPHLIDTEPYAIVTGDFNGDGLPDVAVAGLGSAGVLVLFGAGDGNFRKFVHYSIPAPSGAPDALVVSDFDGDGNLDLAVANYRPGALYVLLGNGNGTFQTPVAYPSILGYGNDWWTGGLAVSDFNGDGHPDIASIAGGDGVAIFLGRGDGTFQTAKFFGTETGYFLAAADFNGDGKGDVATTAGSYFSIMLNTTKP